ncbi:metalloproteinase inhibitor 3-like isoform X2 [Mytilus galloprovincialis]|uniref:metalloproteinase inhibitor 3-like isoform X2 n=2 Tax=Mytilus galloprovincialis TaxID=29158 RepID=UPI003F7B7AC7
MGGKGILILDINNMRTMMMYSSFLVICLFAMSEQCGCPAPYTQQIVCDSPIVVEAKIESFSENDYDKNYQTSVTKFYKGKGTYDTLSNKTTLVTPKGTSMCGPVVLNVGSSYILSVSVYGDKMHHNLCELQVDASSATNKLLEGIAGKYEENCDCEIPSMYDPPQFGQRSNKQCGYSPCHYDTVCARDGNGQCNWHNC